MKDFKIGDIITFDSADLLEEFHYRNGEKAKILSGFDNNYECFIIEFLSDGFLTFFHTDFFKEVEITHQKDNPLIKFLNYEI